jgi:hypothetical protein
MGAVGLLNTGRRTDIWNQRQCHPVLESLDCLMVDVKTEDPTNSILTHPIDNHNPTNNFSAGHQM